MQRGLRWNLKVFKQIYKIYKFSGRSHKKVYNVKWV